MFFQFSETLEKLKQIAKANITFFTWFLRKIILEFLLPVFTDEKKILGKKTKNYPGKKMFYLFFTDEQTKTKLLFSRTINSIFFNLVLEKNLPGKKEPGKKKKVF